jgi:hypothetical protein
MGFVNRRSCHRNFRRRFTSATLLVAYVFTAGGVPLPAGTLAHQGGELFPCSDHACGCQSAEQCWRSCCCHSLAERFAWARVHNVRPPEFAIAEARRGRIDLAWLALKSVGSVEQSCTNCEKPPAEPGAADVYAGGGPIVEKCAHCCSQKHDDQHASGNRHRIVGWKALECQGHSSIWLAAVPSLIAINSCPMGHLPWNDWGNPVSSERARCRSDLPTVPPPEAA